jgi:hypothetical protein
MKIDCVLILAVCGAVRGGFLQMMTYTHTESSNYARHRDGVVIRSFGLTYLWGVSYTEWRDRIVLMDGPIQAEVGVCRFLWICDLVPYLSVLVAVYRDTTPFTHLDAGSCHDNMHSKILTFVS